MARAVGLTDWMGSQIEARGAIHMDEGATPFAEMPSDVLIHSASPRLRHDGGLGGIWGGSRGRQPPLAAFL
ncbi:protein of unknown function (plasmid) [Magnetospirillum sp. XM-1]|nr:protein of unknown function [Magnetospirillum sp. XM-1]